MYPKAPKTVHFNVCNVLIRKEFDYLELFSKPPPSASRPPLRRCGIIVHHWQGFGLVAGCCYGLHQRAIFFSR
jgi:hypothetical protein